MSQNGLSITGNGTESIGWMYDFWRYDGNGGVCVSNMFKGAMRKSRPHVGWLRPEAHVIRARHRLVFKAVPVPEGHGTGEKVTVLHNRSDFSAFMRRAIGPASPLPPRSTAIVEPHLDSNAAEGDPATFPFCQVPWYPGLQS